MIVGIFHAFWHMPLFWVAGTNQIEMGFGLDFLIFMVAGLAFSIYTTWAYNYSGRSTMAATLLHTTGNLSLDALAASTATPQYRLYVLLMAAGAVVIGAWWVWRSCVRPMADAMPRAVSSCGES